MAALDRNESLEGVGGRVTRVRSDEAHHAQEVSKRHAVRERGLDVEPERQAEVLPADVVGQVDQELLPGARSRETVGPIPGLQGYLLELGIYVPERLGRSTIATSFLLKLDDRDTGRKSSRCIGCSLWLFHRKHLDRINGAQHSGPAHHWGHSVVDRPEHFLACPAHHYFAR